MSTADRRRLLGPSDAIIPGLGVSSDPQNVSKKNTKEAQRSADQIRKFFIQTGNIGNANGSAYFEINDTIIEVAVFGPRPIKGSFIDRASFSVECKFLPYINQPNEDIHNTSTSSGASVANNNGRSSLTGIEQKISSYVETSLLSSILFEKYPKSTIDVFINVISFDASKNTLLNLISWIINCSSVAIIDSGIEIKDMVTSGQVQLNEKTGAVTTDAEISEDTKDLVTCVASFMNLKNNEIVGLWIEGERKGVDEKSVKSLIGGCSDMSEKVRGSINAYLLKKIQEQQ